jgi:rhamnosyltransferase subunit B
MPNILLLTQGTWGDIFPFVQIGKMLRERGHQTALLGNRRFTEKIAQSGFDTSSVINIDSFEEWNKDKNLPYTGMSRLMHQKEQIGWIYEIIKNHSSKSNAILVSHCGIHLAVQMAVDQLRVPCLTVYTAPFFMLNTRTLEELWTTHSAVLNGIRASIGLAPVNDWHAWLRSTSRNSVGLWPDWFAAPEPDWPAGVETSGFVSNDQARSLPVEIQEFLSDSASPPVLVNHGSSVPHKKNYFSLCVEACKQLGRRVLLVTQYDELVKDCAGSGIMYCKYVHFPSVIPHIAAIIHHGGIGTSGQALAAGVPQLVLPLGSDRADNASRLARLGVAEHLPPFRWKTDVIAKSLQRLTTHPEVKERCRYFSARSREIDPVVKACEVIEKFAVSNAARFSSFVEAF